MRRSVGRLASVLVVGSFVAACGGKVADPVGRASSDPQNSGTGGTGTSGSDENSAGSCTPAPLSAGGGGVAGGACIEMYESANCGATAYTVECTCPGPCACVVNGQTVDTAPTTSCSKADCPPPDDAWKACGFPAVPGMP